MRFAAFLGALLLTVAPALGQPYDPTDSLRTEPIVVTDLLQIRQLGNVTVSPDGRFVVYTVRTMEPDPDSEGDYLYRTHLHLAPTTGQEPPRPLTRGDRSASQPAWHPDGQHVAFVRSVDGTPQVFVLPLLGGEPFQLTDAEHGATAPQYAPDGEHLLFAASLSEAEVRAATGQAPAWPTERPERAEGDAARATPNPDGTLAEIRAWLDQNRQDASPRVLTRLDFQGELDLSPTDSYRHLFVMEATPGATPVRITDGFYSHGGETWLANGEQIVFSAALDPNQHPDRVEDGNLYLIDPDGQNLRLLLDLEGYTLFDPQLMPEGQTLAFRAVRQADRGFAQTEIGLYDLSGQFPPELLTGSFDRSVSSMAWAPNGRYLYFSAPANGGFPLYRLRPFDGVEAAAEAAPPDNATRPSRRETLLMRTPEVERLTSLERGVRSFGVGPATIFYVMTEVANPYELYASNVAFSNERRLTDHNAGWLATKRLSVPESYTVEHDGFETQYWIMRPTFYEEGQRYPLLLEIHGGPSAMWGPGEVSMWHEFQFFASRGYGIVYSNPRGSGGYGTDFRRGNYQDWGVGPAGDVLAAATEAAREPWVDPRRQVVTGGSYAGYLTAWILTQDTRFQAAAAQRGVYDLATFMGEGNAWRLVPNHFGGYPWDDEPADTAEVSIRTILERNSPQTYVDQIQTPFLIMHGDLDLRTGVIQSEVLYKSLKILERPVEYVRYPGEGHELSRSGDPRLRMDRILRIYEFFGRYVE